MIGRGFRVIVASWTLLFLAVFPTTTGKVYSQAGPDAKYIILMIADGWGEKQIEATNKFTGNTPSYQQSGAGWSKHWISTFPSGGSYNPTQAWSNFTYVLQNPTDSAAAATALYTGLKTQNARITASAGANRLFSIGEQAKALGKSVGAVSSVPLSHATPGAWTSHNTDRSNGYAIADEALFGNPNTTGQPSEPFYAGGLGPTLPPVDVLIGDRRTNYVNDTIRNTLVSDGVYEVVEGVSGQDGGANLLAAANDPNVSQLAGLFDHVFHNANGSGFDPETPTLADSTDAALTVLSRNPNGFVLMVEGGAVDWAGHSNNMNQMIGEMKDFNGAVQAVINWVNDSSNDATWDNTLVIVTGDHETGYLTQAPGVFPDQPLGQVNATTIALEKVYSGSNGRRASWVDADGDNVIDAGETVHWAWNSSNHSNSLIPLYARGAGAELFAGLATGNDPVRGAYLDNTDVFSVMDTVSGGGGGGPGQPTVAFNLLASSGSEATTPASLAVSLSASSSSTVTVNYAVTGGTATNGSDYTIAAGPLTFDPGQTTKTIDLTIIDDALTEGNETVQVTLSNPSNATLGTITVHTYTINDNEGSIAEFVAYNDLAWASGQLNTNITRITSPNGGSGLPSSGGLIDFATGSGTGITLTVTGGNFNGTSHATTQSGGPASGTDAFNVFNGKLTAFGSLAYLVSNPAPPAGNLVLTFSGLNPTKLYDVVYYGHRNNYAWDRAALVTISGQNAFTNQSSAATDNPKEAGGVLFTESTDPSTRLPADNDRGYVARFVDIDPGSDGQFVLTVSFDGTPGNEFKGKYGNAVMLQAKAGGTAAGITVNPTSGLVTTEAGGTATFTVALNSLPTANVTIPLSSSDTTEGTVSPSSLTFTSANGTTPQTVTVTGVNDTQVDGNVAYTIVTGAATSTDTSYSGVNAADVNVTNNDNDTAAAGITVTPTSGLVTTEAGGTATFTVTLNSLPTANVTIPLSSSDTTEGTVSPSSLTFMSANGTTPQTVTVTGVNDTQVDGNVAYTIVTGAATSTDTSYSGVNAADVSVTNNDNDTVTAGITVNPTSGLVTTEAGGTATFTMALNSLPTANVTIPLSSSDTTEGTVSPSSLTFTPTNGTTPQTVTVTGVNDTVVDGNVAYTIVTGAATSTDTSYSGVNAADVSVINNDNDTGGGGGTGFIAYNDLAWASGQLSTNIMTITSPNGGSGLPSSGGLIDFATGSGTGITLTVTGGNFNGTSHATTQSGAPASGTDAFNVFNGKLTAFGSLAYPAASNPPPPEGNLVLTFSGLNPSKRYDVVYYGHRNDYAWDRAALVTISGQSAFTNQSSAATDNPNEAGGVLFTGPMDPSTRLPADNDRGYVARFVDIDPGSDGQFALIVSFDGTPGNEYKGKYGNAVMLQER